MTIKILKHFFVGEVNRRLGLKVIEAGGNAVIG